MDTSPRQLESSFLRRKGWDLLIWITVLAGVGVRVYAAWTLKHLPWRDSGVPMLMAKHFAEGKDVSVFYYGQAYMGSLEPWISSWFVRVLGSSAFAVCLGTVFVGCVVLVLTVAMAKRIAGKRAAWFTSLWMLSSSDAALYLSAHPRGGYMVLLLSGLGMLFFADRFFRASDRRKDAFFSWDLVFAGYVGGLGWWNHQLVVVYMLAVVIAAIPRIKQVLTQRAFFPAIGAFVLGGLPWWSWNIQNKWASLSMSGGLGKNDVSVGAERFVRNTVKMLGWKSEYISFIYVKEFLAVLVVSIAVVLVFREWLRCREPQKRSLYGLHLHLLVLATTFGIYATSHFSLFNTPRYLLPLFPSFAIVAGVVLDRLWNRKVLWIPVSVFLLCLLPSNLWILHRWNDELPQQDAHWKRTDDLADLLAEHADGMVLGDPMQNWVTFASGERARVVDAPYDVYAPYNRQWASINRKVILEDYKGIRSFLESTGGFYHHVKNKKWSLFSEIQSPKEGWDYMEVTDIQSVMRFPERRDVGSVLQDGDLDTRMVVEAGVENNSVEWRFTHPKAVVGMAIPAPEPRGLGLITLTGILPNGETVILHQDVPPSDYFWSNDDLVIGGIGFHRLLRFESPESGFQGMRLTCSGSSGVERSVSEILWMVKSEAMPPSVSDDFTPEPGPWFVNRAVADRWNIAGRKVDILNEPAYWKRNLDELASSADPTPVYLPAMSRLHLLLDSRACPRSLRVLEEAGCTVVDQQKYPKWVEVVVDTAQNSLESVVPVFWTEHGLFHSSDFRRNRWKRSVALMKRLDAVPDLKTRIVERLRHLAPESPEVADVYASVTGKGMGTLADYSPEYVSDTVFSEGVCFRGLDTDWSASDRILTLTWYWEIPAEFNLRKWALFVHFQVEGTTRFQDDHIPGQQVEAGEETPVALSRVVGIERKVTVPKGIDGELVIQFGWLDPSIDKKIKIRKGLRVEKDKTELRIRL